MAGAAVAHAQASEDSSSSAAATSTLQKTAEVELLPIHPADGTFCYSQPEAQDFDEDELKVTSSTALLIETI